MKIRYGLVAGMLWFAWAGSAQDAELQPLLVPDVSQMKLGIADNIESGRKAVEQLLQDPDLDAARKAEAYGGLAQVYHAHKFREEALVAYHNAMVLDPDEVKWPYYLGFVYLEMGKLEEAARGFEAALAREPDDLYSLVRLGHVLLDLNRPEEAAVYLEKALAQESDSVLTLFGMGKVASTRRQFDKAVEYFERALAEQPEATTIHYPLGLAYRGLRDREKATYYLGRRGEGTITFPDPRLGKLAGIVTTSTLQVVLAMAGQADFSARNYEGYILSNLAGKKGVIKYLQDALEFKKNDVHTKVPADELARLHFAIAVLQASRDQRDSAMLSYRSAVELYPEFGQALVNFGDLYCRMGQLELGIGAYGRALELDPELHAIRLARAVALVEHGQEGQAIAALRVLIQKQPEQAEPKLRLATLIQEQNPNEALQLYRDLVDLELPDRERAFAFGNMGTLLQKDKQIKASVEMFEKALQYDSELTDIRLNLAASLGYLDRFEEAIQHYTELTRQDPKLEPAWLGGVAAFVLSAQYDKALIWLEQGLSHLDASERLNHLFARLLAMVPPAALRDGERAAGIMEQLLQRRDTSGYRETLAMALAEAGQFERAATVQGELIEALPDSVDSRRLEWFKGNLDRYRANQTCCVRLGPAVLLPP